MLNRLFCRRAFLQEEAFSATSAALALLAFGGVAGDALKLFGRHAVSGAGIAFDHIAFVIVKPEVFEATLWKGEPRLPTYVEDVPASDLRLWQDRGAHGVKP